MGEDFKVGQWMLHKGYGDNPLRPDVSQIEKITSKLIHYRWSPRSQHVSQARKETVLAAFDTKEEAEALKQALNGIAGELTRRVDAARDAARKQADAVIAKARGL